jgi:hypothetical protein
VIATVPFAPSVFAVIVNVSPASGAKLSLANTLIALAELSSATVAVSFNALGLSLTAVTVIETVATLESAVPSLAL